MNDKAENKERDEKIAVAEVTAANLVMEESSTESPVTEQDSGKISPAGKLDMNKAVSLVSKEQQWREANQDHHGLLTYFAETLRNVGGDIMQPGSVPQVDIPEDVKFTKSRYIDDGPAFDVHSLPSVSITGDAYPSVWSALEELTRQQEILLKKEKEYSAAKAQTKKRLKRMRV